MSNSPLRYCPKASRISVLNMSIVQVHAEVPHVSRHLDASSCVIITPKVFSMVKQYDLYISKLLFPLLQRSKLQLHECQHVKVRIKGMSMHAMI